jgi:hypothetical protein
MASVTIAAKRFSRMTSRVGISAQVILMQLCQSDRDVREMRILVVEDDAKMAELLRRGLGGEGSQG